MLSYLQIILEESGFPGGVVASVLWLISFVMKKRKDKIIRSCVYDYADKDAKTFVRKAIIKAWMLVVLMSLLFSMEAIYTEISSLNVKYSFTTYEFILTENQVTWMKLLSLLFFVLSAIALFMSLLNVNKDIKRIDNKLDEEKATYKELNIGGLLFAGWLILTLIICWIPIFGAIIKFFISYVLALVCVCFATVYYLFIYDYVKYRTKYYIESISITRKDSKKKYVDIRSYQRKNKKIFIMISSKNSFKHIEIFAKDVGEIKRNFNKERSMLTDMKKRQEERKKKKEMKQQNKVMKHVNIKMNNMRKCFNKNSIVIKLGKILKICKEFTRENKAIMIVCTVSVLCCVLCAFSKSNSLFDLQKGIQPWVELVYNISLSVIAAVIFFFVQVFIPNRKRNGILKKWARRYIKEVVLLDLRILHTRIESVINEEVTEEIINDAIAVSCTKVKNEILICVSQYTEVLSDSLIDDLNRVLHNIVLDLIELRVNGKLPNESIKKISENQHDYEQLWETVDRISNEINTYKSN